MGDVKEINVTLTAQDQKSFSRTTKGGTRKRKEHKEVALSEIPVQKTEEPIVIKAPNIAASTIPITIQSKKVMPIGPRINPLKKRMAPMKTLKKPTLQIPVVPGKIEPFSGGKKKRNYTARRISIEMQPIAVSRNNRRILKHNIEKMPIEAVKKTLLEKGILKHTNTTSRSDELLRSMLKDFMSLHAID